MNSFFNLWLSWGVSEEFIFDFKGAFIKSFPDALITEYSYAEDPYASWKMEWQNRKIQLQYINV